MALLTIKNCLDPVLRKTGLHIENIDGEVVTLAENMVETILAAPGVGLAANQIGLPWRMFVSVSRPTRKTWLPLSIRKSQLWKAVSLGKRVA